ncbi:MAG: 4a-hydroxytetrahydrobiopterin dehydratase [Parcubacteria group bacterium Gr01-1014_106]|nr:MAG: 4a-hydroxytetrahydrobiopterin dehydratase [Parcubacteria group bacterium Gr01-1014_106]
MSSPGAEALVKKRCVPCEGGASPLTAEEATSYLRDIPGWDLSADRRTITRTWMLQDFREALRVANRIGELAEAENHHPDLFLHSYRRLRVDLTTHAINGLSENDFILAAKINALERASHP